jgi:hypothetical protein
MEQTLNPLGILHDVVDSFRREQHDSRPNLSASTTWMLQVNGDVQRGKSTVEAFIALVTWCIHTSDLCADRACTFLGTQMRAWAQSPDSNMRRQLQLEDGMIDDDDDGGVARDWLGRDISCVLLTPSSEHDCLQAMRAGGLKVFFRTESQINRVAKLLRLVVSASQLLRAPQTWPVMLLDESDRMLGSCNSAAVEIANGRAESKYETAINDLLGWAPYLQPPA